MPLYGGCSREPLNSAAGSVERIFGRVLPKSSVRLWMNCHAKRMECVQLAGAVGRRGWCESGSKLRAVQTLRAVRLLFRAMCRARACANGVSRGLRVAGGQRTQRETGNVGSGRKVL